MKLHRLSFSSLLFPFLLLMALALGACSPQESSTSAAPAKRELSLETVAAQAKGFSAGALMSTHIAYVFFDAQCPHCGHLWQASEPLHKKVKFVWIPVGMINATSTAQGAALLTAANPVALMSEHEASLLAGKGGVSASASIAPDVEKAIKANTQLLNSFGVEGVPFIVTKNLKSGQTVSRDGAMSTTALAELLGVDAP
ncbi:thioredoxin fold domain-containing protein [Rhodoferax ferrireducens]|uniref:thioredoxin fold domain-containing protein n=1 Tax=Rhodoferax ferrireducens TaxID=192843 RepID=UPI000E0D38CD|nr:thioredoxin fold domain-containing protein [Rhodoferax ferrireducens]